MALVPKIDPNKIFASNAPTQDKPAAFDNYEKGMDETRKNLGRPTIKQANYLHQTADQKVLWIHQNGGGLPYDPLIEYAENAVTLKDGELKQLVGGAWVETKTKSLPATAITTASSQNQQQINDFGGAKWYAKVGGYELGATVKLANGDTVQSTKSANIANPNVDMTGWKKSTVDADALKQYATLALATADIANIALNKNIFVSEAANGGYWYKATAGATSLTKSPYDPLTQAKNYTDQNIDAFKSSILSPSKNLFNKNTKITGKRVTNPTGVISDIVGWSMSDYIPVTAGLSYAVSAEARRRGLAFYDAAKVLVEGSYTDYSTTIVTAPIGAAYLVINVDSDAVTASKVQVEQSVTATSYVEFDGLIKEEKIPTNIPRHEDLVSYVKKTELEDLVEPLTIKNYDIVVVNPNLYDSTKKQVGKLVNSVTGSLSVIAGWVCTDFIPVVAGQYYTISFSTKRVGAAFFTTKESAATTSLGYINSLANPLTVQAPEGANWLVVNLDSDAVTASNVQVEAGNVATPYKEFGISLKIDPSYINFEGEDTSTNKLEIKSGNRAAVSGVVDGVPIVISLQLTGANTHDKSALFQFASDIVNNVIQRASVTDDAAPMRMDRTTLGASHGYGKSNLTLTGHGKTVSDIGSIWSSDGKEYVIVDIVSVDVLSITSRADNVAFSLGTLTHVSGATNTASFTPTATTERQWYPATRDRKLTCFVDNKLTDLSVVATHEFKNTVKFLESYSIMKKSDVLEWLIANKGVNHTNYDAVPCYTVNFGYTFDHECGCTIYFGGVGRKEVALSDQMITQSVQLAQGNGTVYNYIPKATQFTAGGYTYNFSQLENLYSKNPSVSLFLTNALQEAGTNPIDRIIMLNDQVGYATGYLPILDAAPNVRPTNASRKYIEIRTGTLKLYPRLIDSESITQINDGDAFAAIAYRKYFKRSADRTCKYVVYSEMGDYLYLDWHTAKTDEIELPAELIGREFEIFEKSSNVTLLSKFASNSILVKIDASKSYGYLVLRFK